MALARRPRTARLPPVDYVARTRALPVNVLFLMPFFVVYELSLIATQSPVENAAGAWLRRLVGTLGPEGALVVGLLVAALLLAIVLLRVFQAPRDRGLYGGMLAEGLVYGAVLGLAAQALAAHMPLGRGVGLGSPAWPRSGLEEPLAAVADSLEATVERLGLALGAGVFEEVLFRGLVLAGAWLLLRHALGADPLTAGAVAVLGSAWLFAAWHHWGAGAPPWDEVVFRFRFAAGVLLGSVFLARGLGIAALAHGFYDVLVLLGR